ncbi:CesT family type III secretion system chaperone [Castellaniella sp.]|uniref:CesT family type III secretion system chaperone n=2 Tax=Castellaniella sp. TaxID=1955812 RepID=UPI003C7825E0
MKMSLEKEIYENAVKDLAVHVGVDAAALLRSGELTIDGVPVGLALESETEAEPVIQVFCPVGTVPEDGASHVRRELLRANAFGLGTEGATFGMQQNTGKVVLAQRLGAGAGAQALARTMRHLAGLALAWRRQLNLQA